MIAALEEGPTYPRRDKCRHCGEKLGWVMGPIGEAFALGCCNKKECQEKEKKRRVGD